MISSSSTVASSLHWFLLAVVASFALDLTFAFQSTAFVGSKSSIVISSRSFTTRQQHLVAPDHVDALQSLLTQHQALVDLTSSLVGQHTSDTHLIDAATSQWLSDSASAVATDEKDPGLWERYLLIFKNTLLFVHSTIDGPLRSIGWDQTWGVSIFLFTAMARTLLLPLSIQQSKNSEYMKALRPYVTQISEKFKNNEDAKNRAVGKLYEDAEQNPLAGCLTSLAQLPIFLGLYRGIRLLALDGELQEPFLWIPSLQGPVSAETDYRGLDWLTQGWQPNPDGSGLPIPSMGWETTLAFLVMPVVLVLLQSATMRALQPPMDDNMGESEKETMGRTQAILKFLPLMIGFFSLQVPAGLTIYWFTSNIFTLSSSLGVRAYFKANPPKINLPDYWDSALNSDKEFADMTPDERRQATEAGIRIGPTMDELIEEAKFHFYVDRRNTRLLDGPVDGTMDSEWQAWVAAGPAATATPPPRPTSDAMNATSVEVEVVKST